MKGFFKTVKEQAVGIAIASFLGILLGTSDVAKVPFATMFPDQDSIGGVLLPLTPVPPRDNRMELVLIRHSMNRTLKMEFLRRGADAMTGVFAGLQKDATGNAMPLSGGLNGIRFLELEIPDRTLGGTGIALGPKTANKSAYIVTIGDITKNFGDIDDLVVYTKNEERQVRTLYIFAIVALMMVAFFVARSTPQRHPANQTDEEKQMT